MRIMTAEELSKVFGGDGPVNLPPVTVNPPPSGGGGDGGWPDPWGETGSSGNPGGSYHGGGTPTFHVSAASNFSCQCTFTPAHLDDKGNMVPGSNSMNLSLTLPDGFALSLHSTMDEQGNILSISGGADYHVNGTAYHADLSTPTSNFSWTANGGVTWQLGNGWSVGVHGTYNSSTHEISGGVQFGATY